MYFPNALWGQRHPLAESHSQSGGRGWVKRGSQNLRLAEWEGGTLRGCQGLPPHILQMDQQRPEVGRDCARKQNE